MNEVTFHPQVSKFALDKYKGRKNRTHSELYETGI